MFKIGFSFICIFMEVTKLINNRKDQSELLNEIIEEEFNVILIKTASMGLYPKKHLGKSLKELQLEFEKLKEKFHLNVCGEGGEYESLVLDCPIFKSKIIM